MIRRYMWRIIVGCGLVVFIWWYMRSPTLYVSPYGDDANSGTKTHPVKTIQRGVELLSRGGVVSVAPGTYRETVDISDKPYNPWSITLRSEQAGRAVIVGSEPSSHFTWVRCNTSLCPAIPPTARSSVYVTQIDWAQTPTILTERISDQEDELTMARSPNKHIADNNKYHEYWWHTGVDQPSQTTIRDPIHVPSLPDVTGGRLFIMDGLDRCGTYLYNLRISSHTPYTQTFSVHEPIGALTYDHQENGLSAYSKYYIENAPGLLDEPGEWFFDTSDRRLYVWPKTPENPKNISLEIGKRDVGIRIGRSRVTIDGFHVKNINDYSYNDSLSGAILFHPDSTIRDIRLSNISVTHAGNGILAQPAGSGSLQDLSIYKAQLTHIARSGISLIGNTHENSTIKNVNISHSTISRSGFSFNNSAVNLVRSKNVHISNNDIHDVASNGIHITGYEKLPISNTAIRITHNTVDHACQNVSSCAAIKIFGGNFIHTNVSDNILKNNVGWSFCEEATQQIPGYAMGVFISNASGVTVANNISSTNSGPAFLGFTRQMPATNNTFSHNIAEKSLTGISLEGADGETDVDTEANTSRHDNTTIADNTFFQNKTALHINPANPKTIHINKNLYKENGNALVYNDIVLSTPSAIHRMFPFWE